MSDKTSKETGSAGSFPAGLSAGFVIAVGTIAARAYFGAHGLNDVFLTVAIIYAIIVGFVFLLARFSKKTRGELREFAFGSLFGSSLFAFGLSMMCGMTVLQMYRSVPAAITFVEQDFVRFADSDGSVSTQRLRQEWLTHGRQHGQLRSLDDMAAKARDLEVSAERKAALAVDVKKAQDEIRGVMLPEDVAQRLWSVERVICDAGRQLPATDDAASHCIASRWELVNLQLRLDADYAWWAWLLRRVGAL